MKREHLQASVHLLQSRLSGHPLEALITLAITTGMRRDELRQLTWSEIDLAKREMHVLNSKTKRDVRLIHVSEECTSVLKQHLLRQMEQKSKAGTVWSHLDLVFPDHRGELQSTQHFLEEWSALLEQVGLPPQSFHSLRVLVWHRHLEQRQAAQEERKSRWDASLGDDTGTDAF
jgi:integrase